MIADDIESNRKLSPIVTELFLISQPYFKVPQTKTKCNTLFYHGNL